MTPGVLVRFTRWQALLAVFVGADSEHTARRWLCCPAQEITFTGLLWGPAKHFEIVEEP